MDFRLTLDVLKLVIATYEEFSWCCKLGIYDLTPDSLIVGDALFKFRLSQVAVLYEGFVARE